MSSQEIRILILVLTILAAFALCLKGQRNRIISLLLSTLLLLTLLLSFLSYSRALTWKPSDMWGRVYAFWGQQVDPYDLMFYYLNTKYFAELGYFDLYPAALIVNKEFPDRAFSLRSDLVLFQNREGYQLSKRKQFENNTALHDELRARFSSQRWAAFEQDFLHLQRNEGGWSPRRWTNFFWDHGFNGAPFWVAFWNPIVQYVPVSSVKLLALTDLLLLLVALTVVLRTYGWKPAVFVVIFFFVSKSTEWPSISQVLGRYDAISLSLLALACLRKGSFRAAGILSGITAALRFFPFLFCVWAVAVLSGKEHGSLCSKENALRFLLFSLAAFLACNVYAACILSPSSLADYYYKMKAHTATENITKGKVGLPIALIYRGENDLRRVDGERIQRLTASAPWRIPLAIVLSLPIFLIMRRSDPDEGYALGVLFLYLLTAISFHYYVFFALPLVIHANDIQTRKDRTSFSAVALFLLLGAEAFTRFIELFIPEAFVTHTSVWSVFLLCYVMWVIFGKRRDYLSRAAGITAP